MVVTKFLFIIPVSCLPLFISWGALVQTTCLELASGCLSGVRLELWTVIIQGYSKLLSEFYQLVTHNILEIGVCVFIYLIEQHSKFLLRTLQVLYMCTLCDPTNINTIIEFVPKLYVACQGWWFQWRFWFVPLVPGYLWEEELKADPWRNPIERNHMGLHLENEVGSS